MVGSLLISLGSFVIVVLASKQIGEYLTRFHLPLISGYLLAGIVVGPFVLRLITSEGIGSLGFISDLSLAFIAFAAGSELFLEEIRARLRSIAWHTAAQLVAIYALGALAFFALADAIPFMHNVPLPGRISASLLAGAILVARSPSSAIAIVNELRAKGHFTKTVLGVTVVMDVVVVVTFAFSSSIADVLLTSEQFNLGFLALLALEMTLSALAGYLVGRLLNIILAAHLRVILKTGLVLLTGLAIFLGSLAFREFTHQHLPFEILLEPLLICIVASFWVTNYSPYRDEFAQIIQEAGPYIYVVFFTFVGDALALDTLAALWPVALALFGVRMAGMLVGGLAGGRIAGDPPQHSRLMWLAFVTQAGIALGLAQEVTTEFPQLGEDFATLLIAVIVISQLVGPPLLKFAIRRVGEAHLPEQPEPDAVRDALVLGIDGQTILLAQRLKAHNWQVILADTNTSHVEQAPEYGLVSQHVPALTVEALSTLVTRATDAVVVMLDSDDANLRACELAYEHFGIRRLIVRLQDLSRMGQFTALGALVVHPATTMVNLLDHLVRAPQSTTLLLQDQPESEVVQITITDEDVDGLPLRDLRMPGDVLVLGIVRDGHTIVARGHTILRLHDEVTLVGNPKSLEQVTLRLGY